LKGRSSLVAVASVLASLAFSVQAHTAQAAVPFAVDDLSMEVDDNIGNGICHTANDKCTLRAAIQEANAHNGDDTITLPIGTFDVSNGKATNKKSGGTFLAGTLDVTDTTGKVTITGDSQLTTIIQSRKGTRIFNVAAGAELILNDLTVSGGSTRGVDTQLDQFNFNGGNIYNLGKVALSDVLVTLGKTDACGANIFNAIGASLSIENSEISKGKVGKEQGGGICNKGTITKLETTYIHDNQAKLAGGGLWSDRDVTADKMWFQANKTGNSSGDGGGAILVKNADLTLTNSTLNRNISTAYGGAVAFKGVDSGTTLTITNATFVDNGASKLGGAVYVFPGLTGSVSAALQNVTIAKNHAGSRDDTTAGGGIDTGAQVDLTLKLAIFSQNSPQNCGSSVVDAAALSMESGHSCGLQPWSNNFSDIAKIPLLAPAENGGPIPHILTMKPDLNNVNVALLVDIGGTVANGDCTATDQLGQPRATKKSNTTNECDAGAFEVQQLNRPLQ
jgi:CSLREA domain-containing protein